MFGPLCDTSPVRGQQSSCQHYDIVQGGLSLKILFCADDMRKGRCAVIQRYGSAIPIPYVEPSYRYSAGILHSLCDDLIRTGLIGVPAQGHGGLSHGPIRRRGVVNFRVTK